MFWCPGCECSHVYWVSGADKPAWKFNGDIDKPTFTPSLRTTYDVGRCCHLFLTDGVLRYCSDSYHSLAGKDVPLGPEPFSRVEQPESEDEQ